MFANFAPQQQLNLPLLHILIFFLFLLFVLQNGISGHDLSRGRRFNALKAKGSPKIERRIKRLLSRRCLLERITYAFLFIMYNLDFRLRCIEEAINPLKIKGPPKAVAPPKTVGTFLLAAEKDSVTWKKTTMMPAKGLGMKSSSNSANPTITTRLISSLHLPIVNADYYYGGDYGGQSAGFLSINGKRMAFIFQFPQVKEQHPFIGELKRQPQRNGASLRCQVH
jgi:hypothetical protein